MSDMEIYHQLGNLLVGFTLQTIAGRLGTLNVFNEPNDRANSLRPHAPDKLFPPGCRANKNYEFTRPCFSGCPAAIIMSY
jgi:hypothetical protein